MFCALSEINLRRKNLQSALLAMVRKKKYIRKERKSMYLAAFDFSCPTKKYEMIYLSSRQCYSATVRW